MAWTIEIDGVPKPFQTARMTWTLDGSGGIEVTMREVHIDDDWRVGLHEIVALEDGTPRWGGYLDRLDQSGSVDDVTFTASGYGFARRLDYRIVRHAYTIEGSAYSIVASLLGEAQIFQFNGDMGFTLAPSVGTTDDDSEAYCFGVVIADAIRDLAANNFDWDVGPNKELRIWAPSRGVPTGLSFAKSNCITYNVEQDAGELLTTVSAIGSPEDPFGPMHDMVRSGEATIYGRREIALDLDTTKRPRLIKKARQMLRARGGALTRVSTTWLDPHSSLTATRPDLSVGAWPFGAVWLDDTVTVPLASYFGGDDVLRCIEVRCDLEPTGGEIRFVSHVFDGLVDTFVESEETDEE